jgi:hypothetical protein
MTYEPTPARPFASDTPRLVLNCLNRHGGSMRIGPLVARCGLDFETLAAAITELAERRWARISWRKPRTVLPPGLPERCRSIDRITTTRFGRWRYSATWPVE